MNNEANALLTRFENSSATKRRLLPLFWTLGGRVASIHFRVHRPIFVVGAARSGTTLLFQIIGSQPHLTSLFEPNELWLMVMGHFRDDTCQGAWTRDRGYQLLWLYYSLLKKKRPILLSKDPRDSLRVDLLYWMFPNARFVHIVRDGRDVVASITKIWEGDNYRVDQKNDWVHVRIPGYESLVNEPPHKKAALMWALTMRKLSEDLARVPMHQQMTIRYEELVAAPVAVAQELSRFLFDHSDLEALSSILEQISPVVRGNHEMEPRQKDNESRNPGFSQTWVKSNVIDDAGSGTMSTSTRIGKWATDLSERQIQESIQILKPMLQRYGYEY